MSKRKRTKHATTLAERLAEQARIVQEDMEKLSPGDERDAMVQKFREIEAAINFNRALGTPARSKNN
jgi:hypothetical protein